MNTERHLNDILATRSFIRNSHEEQSEHHSESYEEVPPVASPMRNDGGCITNTQSRQPTLIDMLMNSSNNVNTRATTTTITVGGSTNVSPAVLDYMRVSTNQTTPGNKKNAPIEPVESVPLEIMFATRYAERVNSINKRIELRERDEYDEDEEDEEGFNNNRMNEPNTGNDTEEAMMRELFGESGVQGADNQQNMPPIITRPPSKKKRRVDIVPASKDQCFLCQFGDRFHDGIRAPHIAKLNNIIDKFYGRMSNFDLACCVSLYFNEKIYAVTENIPMLRVEIILEHIEGRHSLNATNFLIESIHDYEKVKFIAKASLCKADGTLDKEAFAIFDKTQSKLEKLYTMDITKMNFNEHQTKEDLNSKGSYTNLLSMYSQREDYENRLKRKASAIDSASTTFDLS